MYEPIMMANNLKEGTYESNWNKYHIGTLDLSRSDDGLTPGNMLVYPTAGKEERRNNAHPTVKPLALMKRLVTMYSPKGALILDPFMGSGTTGVACVELDREFIGVELEKRYFDIADRRIKAAHSPTPQTTKGDLTEGYLPPSLTLDGNLFDIDLRP
jgi:site-specific DNA-methyltransferase (adenine-specific)